MSFSEAHNLDAAAQLRQALLRAMQQSGDQSARSRMDKHPHTAETGSAPEACSPPVSAQPGLPAVEAGRPAHIAVDASLTAGTLPGAAAHASTVAHTAASLPQSPAASISPPPPAAVAAALPEDADRSLSFDALVEKYQKKIFNVIYRKIGDYEEAADLTQETFINAYRHYDRFRGQSKVFTWLYQIATNLCINRLRQRERHKGVRVESLDQPRDLEDSDGLTREVADFTHAPQDVLEDKELRQRILAAVDSLPPDYKEVVLLREFHDMSYNEIVEATGLSLENVKTRLSRARGMLRRKLEPYIKM